MNRYIQITIITNNSDESDILVARLAHAGYEGFEEEPKRLHAFIPESFFEITKVEEIIKEVKGISDSGHPDFQTKVIEPKNWNAEWERNFEPVVVDNFCTVRADFHKAGLQTQYDLIITPKMSFGTGHHATTYMMIAAMKDLHFKNKTVLDFGTGTGVLAILASKMGANSVVAIDSDSWSIENTLENIEVNGIQNITVEQRSQLSGLGKFDIILANINLHVILENLPKIRQHLLQGGVFIGSGLLISDEVKLKARSEVSGFKSHLLMTRDNWLCFELKNL